MCHQREPEPGPDLGKERKGKEWKGWEGKGGRPQEDEGRLVYPFAARAQSKSVV